MQCLIGKVGEMLMSIGTESEKNDFKNKITFTFILSFAVYFLNQKNGIGLVIWYICIKFINKEEEMVGEKTKQKKQNGKKWKEKENKMVEGNGEKM